jgi:hypothetical protein
MLYEVVPTIQSPRVSPMKAQWTIQVAEDNENEILILELAFLRIKDDVFIADGQGKPTALQDMNMVVKGLKQWLELISSLCSRI